MVTATTAWFALTVAPRKEKITAQTLRTDGFEEFLPLRSSSRLWSDQIKKIQSPLFPGYVFCRFDPRVRQTVLKTPGVVSIVSFGKIPEPIHDSEISALQSVCRSGLTATTYPTPKIGSTVRLHEGPLRGIDGILLEDRDTRLIITLTLLQRSIAVVIDRDWIAPIRALACFDSR